MSYAGQSAETIIRTACGVMESLDQQQRVAVFDCGHWMRSTGGPGMAGCAVRCPVCSGDAPSAYYGQEL